MDNRQSMMIPTASGGGAPACDNSGGGAGALRSSGGANNAARGNNNNNNNRQYSNRGNAGQRYQSRNYKRESRSITQNIKDTIESGRYFANNTGPRSLLLDAQLPKTKKKMAVGNVSIKERFVQANCQFLLAKEAADFDAQAYAQDPDLPVNWDNVEEVFLTCTDNDFCCPICLHHPTAGKITRCGHVYCWSCILHYLRLDEDTTSTTRPCPICFEKVRAAELKSVTIKKKVDFVEHNYLTLNLMKVRKGSSLALPVDAESSSHRMFTKHLLASSEELFDIMSREQAELDQQLQEYQAEGMPEVCFVQQAIDELGQRREKMTNLEALKREMNIEPVVSPPTEPSGEYLYFYQSEDAQHIYLHSLNIRMLKHEFGDLRTCPKTITAKIIELHRETITQDSRRRFPHLRHLPISCEYRIAELELDDTHVSVGTLRAFENEIKNRARNRKRKERTQRQRDRAIDVENKKRMGLWAGPNYRMNVGDFPLFQGVEPEADEDETVALANRFEAFPAFEPSGASPPPGPSSTSNVPASSSSFAKMLTTGRTTFDLVSHNKHNNTTAAEKKNGADEDDEESANVVVSNLTLSDYFDECLKTKVKKGKNKKKK